MKIVLHKFLIIIFYCFYYLILFIIRYFSYYTVNFICGFRLNFISVLLEIHVIKCSHIALGIIVKIS